jgi:O-antigen ligase
LVWNFSLFWVVATYGSRYSSLFPVVVAGFLGAITGIALLAPLGVNWLFKFALLRPLLERIPSPLVGVFQGAESGFHPNQVAGTLLYALPLMIALSVYWTRSLRRGPVSVRQRWLAAALGGCTLIVGGVLLLTQSRSGLMGLGVALTMLALWPRRWGRWLLLVGALLLIGALVFYPDAIVDRISDAPPTEALGGLSTLGFRQQVWNAALWGLADFPFTGMGLGTFRELAFLLYPLAIDPNYDIGHAHNFFLQTGLDFGLPGLIALLAIYFSTAALLVHLWRTGEGVQLAGAPIRVWALGLLATLAGQTAYSMLDAVAMGARTNFAWWWLLAIALAVGNWRALVREARQSYNGLVEEKTSTQEV